MLDVITCCLLHELHLFISLKTTITFAPKIFFEFEEEMARSIWCKICNRCYLERGSLQPPVLPSPACSPHVLARTEVDVVVVTADRS